MYEFRSIFKRNPPCIKVLGQSIVVNGERLNFEKVVCADGDVINIGQNYVLVLSLFNALDKLSVSYGFDRIPELKKVIEKPVEAQLPTANIIGGMSTPPTEDHSTNITHDLEEASVDFYKPTKQQGQDHYNNKTIIL